MRACLNTGNQQRRLWSRLTAIGLITATLGACGGGDGSSKGKIDVNGAANIGASLTGVVHIYPVNADGVDRSQDLANATQTATDGGFSLEISNTDARALYIEVESDGQLSITCGAEICERLADGSTSVSFGDTYTPSKTISLSGMVALRDSNDDELDSVTANLSVLSTIAAGLAQSKVSANVQLDDIVRETNDQVADRFDIEGDLLSISLVDTSSTEDINQADGNSLRDSLKATGVASASLINGSFDTLSDAINGVVQQFIDFGIADRETAPSPAVTLEETLEAAISLLDLLKTVEGVNAASVNFQTAEIDLTDAEQEAQNNGSTIPTQGGIDTDGDGMLDVSDPDDDNDGVNDQDDAFPLDDSEFADTDDDGVGNNADNDDDNDGVDDGSDAFPLDSGETVDTDNDGIGNNADPDDDNDGVNDGSDAFPLDDTESSDSDGDGVGDNADTDIDGDGVDNDIDNCPFAPNAGQENTYGDERGDACEDDEPQMFSGDFVKGRVFNVSGADVSRLMFFPGGIGAIKFIPAEFNDFDEHDYNKITSWSITESGGLKFIEEGSDGDTYHWELSQIEISGSTVTFDFSVVTEGDSASGSAEMTAQRGIQIYNNGGSFTESFIVGKTFWLSATGASPVNRLSFDEDGTGLVRFEPNPDNDFDEDDVNPIAWSIDSNGVLTYVETDSDGFTYTVVLAPTSQSNNSVVFDFEFSSSEGESGGGEAVLVETTDHIPAQPNEEGEIISYALSGVDYLAFRPDGSSSATEFAELPILGTLNYNSTTGECQLIVDGESEGCFVSGYDFFAGARYFGTITPSSVTIIEEHVEERLVEGDVSGDEIFAAYLHGTSESSSTTDAPGGSLLLHGTEAVEFTEQGSVSYDYYSIDGSIDFSSGCQVTSTEGDYACSVIGNSFSVPGVPGFIGTAAPGSVTYVLRLTTSGDNPSERFHGVYTSN